jgi:hypothetical protein
VQGLPKYTNIKWKDHETNMVCTFASVRIIFFMKIPIIVNDIDDLNN